MHMMKTTTCSLTKVIHSGLKNHSLHHWIKTWDQISSSSHIGLCNKVLCMNLLFPLVLHCIQKVSLRWASKCYLDNDKPRTSTSNSHGIQDTTMIRRLCNLPMQKIKHGCNPHHKRWPQPELISCRRRSSQKWKTPKSTQYSSPT
jgi:hypothetical protein